MPLLVLLLLVAPMPALAVVTYDDGGVHVVDGPREAVEVLNGTTVLTVPGAEVLSTEFRAPGIKARGASALGVFGGAVVGSEAPFPTVGCIGPFCSCRDIISLMPYGGHGVDADGGTVSVSGGTLRGGDASASAGTGLMVHDVTDLTVVSGTLQGGESLREISPGGAAMIAVGSTVSRLLDGTYLGGRTAMSGSRGIACPPPPALYLSGFTYTDVIGGSFVGGSTAEDPQDIGPSLLIDDFASVEIRGGTFDGPWVIRGPDAVVEVFGRSLSIAGICGSVSGCTPVAIFGELEDGSALWTGLNLEDGATLPVLHEVPEPSGPWLAVAALGALGVLRKSKEADRRPPGAVVGW